MSDVLIERINSASTQAALAYHRLVLVVGDSSAGKTAALLSFAKNNGCEVINVNLRLCERLLELTGRARARRAADILRDVLQNVKGDTVVLDNLEVLFGVELRLDPLRLLYGISRDRTIIAAWPGRMDGQALTYAEHGHPEYWRETNVEALVVADTRSQDIADSRH